MLPFFFPTLVPLLVLTFHPSLFRCVCVCPLLQLNPCVALSGGVIRAQSRVPAEMLCEIIFALMADYGGTIGSRDLGRELNKISVLEDRTKALTVIKEVRRARRERGAGERE